MLKKFVFCKKLVKENDKAVLCEIFCKSWFHCACVAISDEEYEYMRLLAEKSKWACKACDSRLCDIATHLDGQLNDIISVIDLNKTVNKLVTVVKGLASDNLALNDKFDRIFVASKLGFSVEPEVEINKLERPELDIGGTKVDLVTSRTYRSALVNNPKSTKTTLTKPNKVGNDNLVVDVAHSGTNDISVLSKVNDRFSSVSESYQSESNEASFYRPRSGSDGDEIVGVGSVSVNGWETVSHKKLVDKRKKEISVHRKKVRKDPIIGSKTEVGKFRAVGKLEWVFLSRLAPEVSVEDLSKYLSDSNVIAECVELKAKHNTYKSFKIGVTSNLTSKVLDAEFWPSGTLVRKFIAKNEGFATRTFLGKR